jgi:hypothetical protein
MRYFNLLVLLILTNVVHADCEVFIGKWINCTVDTPRLNIIKRKLLNAYIRPYTIDISKVDASTLRFVGTYKKLFSRRETIHDDFVVFNENITIFWADMPDGKAGPVLEMKSICKNNKIYEEIEWANLDLITYPEDYVAKNDRFFNSKYFVEKDYFHRKIYSKKLKEDEFKYLGTLTCKKD